MKKYMITFFSVLFCLILLLSLAACVNDQDRESQTPTPSQAGSVAISPPADPAPSGSLSPGRKPPASSPGAGGASSQAENAGDMVVRFKDPADSDQLEIIPKQ